MQNPSKQTSNSPATQDASGDTTSIATSCAAAQAVFQTAELVENIVLFLPPINIFGVRRVSKAFNNTLKSRDIQEKVFLRRKYDEEPPRSSWTMLDDDVEGYSSVYVTTPSPFVKILDTICADPAGSNLSLSGRDPGPDETVLLDPSSSVLDTHFCDSCNLYVLVQVTFQVGPYKIRNGQIAVLAQTWRAAIEGASAQEAEYRIHQSDGRLVKHPKGAQSMGQAIKALEEELGCRAGIVLAQSTKKGVKHLEVFLRRWAFAENEDWKTNGKAPWAGYIAD